MPVNMRRIIYQYIILVADGEWQYKLIIFGVTGTLRRFDGGARQKVSVAIAIRNCDIAININHWHCRLNSRGLEELFII